MPSRTSLDSLHSLTSHVRDEKVTWGAIFSPARRDRSVMATLLSCLFTGKAQLCMFPLSSEREKGTISERDVNQAQNSYAVFAIPLRFDRCHQMYCHNGNSILLHPASGDGVVKNQCDGKAENVNQKLSTALTSPA